MKTPSSVERDVGVTGSGLRWLCPARISPSPSLRPGEGGRRCAERASEGRGCASPLSFSSWPAAAAGPRPRHLSPSPALTPLTPPGEWPLAGSLGLENLSRLGVPEALAGGHCAPLLRKAGALVSERRPDPQVEPGTSGGGRPMSKSRTAKWPG